MRKGIFGRRIHSMLRIYICPKCYNFRMVSRKPDAMCFHCGTNLEQCDLEYTEYINMTEEQRNQYREDYKNRMMMYREKMDEVLKEKAIFDVQRNKQL